MEKFRTWAISVVRTSIVPGIVGLLATWFAYAKTDMPTDVAPTVATGLSFGYWFVVRLLEQKFPRAGVLLLIPRPPTYTDSDFRGFAKSAVRTFIPLVVGLAATYATKLGVDIDTTLVNGFLGVFASGSYYATVRAVETNRPEAGRLLGIKGAPTYIPDNGELRGGDDD